MTRRRIDYAIEPDMFGFDAIGADFMSSAIERRALLGLGPLAMAVYWACLKPFAKGDGRVYALSYYRLLQILKHARTGAGRPKQDPTLKQLRDCISALERVDLVIRDHVGNEQKGVLQIWLRHGVGGTATKRIRAGQRAGVH